LWEDGGTHMLRHMGMCRPNGLHFTKKLFDKGPILVKNIEKRVPFHKNCNSKLGHAQWCHNRVVVWHFSLKWIWSGIFELLLEQFKMFSCPLYIMTQNSLKKILQESVSSSSTKPKIGLIFGRQFETVFSFYFLFAPYI